MVLLNDNDISFLRRWRGSVNELFEMSDIDLLKARLESQLIGLDNFLKRVDIGAQADGAFTQAESEMPRVVRAPCGKCGRPVATIIGKSAEPAP